MGEPRSQTAIDIDYKDKVLVVSLLPDPYDTEEDDRHCQEVVECHFLDVTADAVHIRTLGVIENGHLK